MAVVKRKPSMDLQEEDKIKKEMGIKTEPKEVDKETPKPSPLPLISFLSKIRLKANLGDSVKELDYIYVVFALNIAQAKEMAQENFSKGLKELISQNAIGCSEDKLSFRITVTKFPINGILAPSKNGTTGI